MGTKTKDLTVGNPLKLIIGFVIPIYFGMLFQQFYGLVDTMIVGKTLGVEALAAVGATGSITFMVIGLCNGIASGFAIPVAQRFGAKDEKGLKTAIANSIWLGIIISVILTAIVMGLCYDILKLMNTPENIIEGSFAYLIIIFAGIPVTFFFNLFSGFMRSMGDSKTPVIVLVICCAINIVLDYVFIVYVHMGVAGAGYATVISQFVAAVISGVYMWVKFPVVRMSKHEMRFQGHTATQLCFMGFPMGLQYSITAIGSVILQASVNGLGSSYVAAMTSGCKIAMFAVPMIDALGSTMATYGGQNVGAKKLDRVEQGLKQACLIGFAYAIFACAFVSFFGETLALLFVDASETEIIHNVAVYLRTESGFYVLLVLVNCVRFCIQGMGFSGLAVFAGVMEMIARILVAVFVVPMLGYLGACLASPVAWILADLFLIPAFFHAMKKLRIQFEGNAVNLSNEAEAGAQA